MGVLCGVGLWLAANARAHAEFAWSDLWSAADPETVDEIYKRSAPLDWFIGNYRPQQVLYFAGFDAQRFSAGGYVGAVWSPLSGSDGLLFRLFAADGIDSFRAPKQTFVSESLRAAAMTGYRINRSGFDLSGYAGFEALARVYLPITKTTRLQPQVGMRLSADIWWQPIDDMMVSANVSVTTIEASVYGRLASGVRILDLWTGPEVSASTDIFGEQYRFGACDAQVHMSLIGIRRENRGTAGIAIKSKVYRQSGCERSRWPRKFKCHPAGAADARSPIKQIGAMLSGTRSRSFYAESPTSGNNRHPIDNVGNMASPSKF